MTHRLRQLPHRGRRSQRGFTLVELIVAVSIAALLAIYAQSEIARASEDQIAKAAGTFIKQVSAAAEQHVLVNFDELSTGTDVTTTANDLRPTVAELVAERLLPSGFPTAPGTLPTRQDLRIDVIKTACPGISCNIVATVCTTTGVTLGSANVRYDLAQVIVDQQNGTGGLSTYTAPAAIKGPILNMANPNGPIAGTVCGSSTSLNNELFQKFVRIRDTRDPDLQGNLSAQGNLAITGTSTLTGDVAAAGTVSVTGNGAFAGASPTAVPAGLRGVSTQDMVASGNILTTDQGAGFTGSNGNYVAMTSNSGGEAAVVTSGRMAGQRIIPTGAFMKGSSCIEAGAIGLSASEASGSLVVCSSGRWTPLTTTAVAGGPCTLEGQGATDQDGLQLYCTGGVWTPMRQFLPIAADNTACTALGQVGYSAATAGVKKAMLCRANPQAPGVLVWKRMEDVTTNLVFVRSVEVTDGTSVPKPACSNAGNPGAMPIIQMIPKSETTTDGGLARFAIDNGGAWTTRLLTGSGTPMPNGSSAIATLYCYFP
ncbi:type II secretion system protein [Variovorax gossypii]|uniref:type II secretion system protein n=1 Tax=uncultured Variovorax sp. TaxID=114708 RepID=UPI002623A2CA|nr:prepilin-type N-terminal cleavage/methylation domain-containing protein [uncultured Variovorax sp.]